MNEAALRAGNQEYIFINYEVCNLEPHKPSDAKIVPLQCRLTPYNSQSKRPQNPYA